MTAVRLAFGTAIFWVGLWLSAGAAPAQYFGAIGYSPATGAMGWGLDYPSPDGARRAAIAKCAEYARDCLVLVVFKDGCGVIAEGDEAYAGAASPSRTEAQRVALRRCDRRTSGCEIKRWVCTTRSLY